MDREYTIVAPDGREATIIGPDNATREQLRAAAQRAFERMPKAEPAGAELSDVPKAFVQQTTDLLGGAARGAGSIGATLLAPHDALTQFLLERKGQKPGNLNQQRREAITEGTRLLGADPASMTYGVSKLGTEIGGTAAVGPVLGGAAARVPVLAKTGLPLALETAGMKGGSMVPRVIGGAVTGGAAAGLIDPSQAPAGAAIGGALPPALKAAGWAGQQVGRAVGGAASHGLGMTTGVGAEPIKQAFKAGATKSQTFVDNIRGNVPLTDVLDDAKSAVANMYAKKSAQYRSGMVPIKADKTVLGFADIDKALQDAANVATFKGQIKNDKAGAAITRMREIVDEWRALDPADFHTPEGFDALKQKLAGVLESIPYQERTARLAAGKIHSAAKESINRQAPAYAKVMKDYQRASDLISEIERALSLNERASADTAMRKLQSLMRNNVQTNYGNRLALARALEREGGADLMPAIAGQALNSWTPRSLAGQVGAGATMLGSAFASNPLMLAALPLQSPRLVGSVAYQAGRMFGQSPANVNALAALGGPSFEQLAYRSAPVFLAPTVTQAASR